MKKKYCISTLLLFFTILSFAQDTICKSNGSKIIAKVTEVNSSTIKYIIVNDGTNIPVEAPKSEIVYVIYANGVKEVFGSMDTKREFTSVVPLPEGTTEKPDAVKDKNNIIAINYFDLLFTNLSLSYERFSKSGLLSFKIPLSVGFGGYYNEKEYIPGSSIPFLRNRLYSGGLEFNIYPLKRTKNTFYAGISAAVGSFVYYEYILPPGPYAGTGNMYLASAEHVRHIGEHYSGMLHVGGYLEMSDHLLMGAKIALGAKLEDTVEPDYLLPKLQLDLNFAYRF